MDPDKFQQAAIGSAIHSLCNWEAIPESILSSTPLQAEDADPDSTTQARVEQIELLKRQLVATIPFVWTVTRHELHMPDQQVQACMHPQAVGTPWGALYIGGQKPGGLNSLKVKHETSWMRQHEPGRQEQDYSRVFQASPSVFSKQVVLIEQEQQSKEWKASHAVPQLSDGLLGHSAVAYKFKVYIFGGQRNISPQDAEDDVGGGNPVPRCSNGLTSLSIEKQGQEGRPQHHLPVYQQGAVPSARMCHSAAVDTKAGIMYLYGGVTYRKRDGARVPADDAVGIIYAYNFDLCTWSKITTTGDCPRSTTLLGFTVQGGSLLSIPDVPLGVGASRSRNGYQLLQLDLESKVWTRVETQGNPPKPRCEAAVALLGDCLLVYGGKDTSVTPNKLLGDVHCLHLDTKTWEEIHPQLAHMDGGSGQGLQQGAVRPRQDQKSAMEASGAAGKAAGREARAGGEASKGLVAGGAGGAAAGAAGAVREGPSSSSSPGSGMMLLAGHGGAAFGGSAVFFGGYRELAAPKPQPCLQVLVKSVRPPLPALAQVPGIGSTGIAYGVQHCRQQLARLVRSCSSQQVLLKPQEGAAVAVPRALLALYSQLFDDLFDEMLDAQEGVPVVPLPGVGGAGAQSACRWMVGLLSLEGQPLASLVQVFRVADILVMEQLLSESLEQLLGVDVSIGANATTVLELAGGLPNRSELQDLAARAEQTLLQKVNPHTAPTIMGLALQHKSNALQAQCISVMIQHRKNDVWAVLDFALQFQLVKLQGSCLAHMAHSNRGFLIHQAEALAKAVQHHGASSSSSSSSSKRWQDAPLMQMLQKDLLQEAKEVIVNGDRQLLGYVAAAEKLQLSQLREGLVRHLQQQEVWQRLCSTGQVALLQARHPTFFASLQVR